MVEKANEVINVVSDCIVHEDQTEGDFGERFVINPIRLKNLAENG